MSFIKALIKNNPKISAAIGTAIVAGAAVYAPGSGPVIQSILSALFGG